MTNYENHFEIGRVCFINYGEDEGKLCTIIDIIDQNWALVDGPRDQTGVHRQQYNFKRLSLTPFKLEIPRNARLSTLSKAFKAGDVLAKWAKTGTAQRFANQKIRRNLTDFDRFKLMVLKKKKSQIIGKEVAKLRKASNAGKAGAAKGKGAAKKA